MKDLLKDKNFGFYVVPVVALICIVTAIMYSTAVLGNEILPSADTYHQTGMVWLMVLGAVFTLLAMAGSVCLELLVGDKTPMLSVARKTLMKIAPWILLLSIAIAFMVFAPNALDIITRVSQGLTPMGAVLASKLIPTIVCFVLTLLLAVVTAFLPMITDVDGAEASATETAVDASV